MNKKLTALEALRDLREVKGWNDDELNKRLDIIEKALKTLEDIKDDFEFLDITREDSRKDFFDYLKRYGSRIKAFEIIKEKKVNVEWLLQCENVDEYNESLYDDLTKREFDLLKETLC